MKILLVHNYYGSSAPSGENTVFETEKELLRKNGHDLLEYTVHSDILRNSGLKGSLKGALCCAWNFAEKRRIRKLLRAEKPDVMHVHNTFPLLSPAIFSAAEGTTTATVLTLHNYRLFCAAAVLMRNRQICTACLDKKSVVPALRHGCYRKSRFATAPLAGMILLHQAVGTWNKHVDCFIALTQYQKDIVTAAGLPPRKVSVKPQVHLNAPSPRPWNDREMRMVYIGRLSEEKGVLALVDIWREWGEGCPVLEIVGDGPLKNALIDLVAQYGLGDKIRLRGRLSFPETQAVLSSSRMLLVPSFCMEGFPMVIPEAFALGVPVAGSALGSLPDIIHGGRTGVMFSPADTLGSMCTISGLWRNQSLLEDMSLAARSDFEKKYSAEINLEILMGIYKKAIFCRLSNAL